MSWEGYDQVICKNGHYYTDGCDMYNPEEPCPHCQADSAWRNTVDETNCDSHGEIPFELLKKHYLISEQIIETCNLGHRHVTSQAVFRIPAWEEGKKLQHRREYDGRTPLIPLYPEELAKMS